MTFLTKHLQIPVIHKNAEKKFLNFSTLLRFYYCNVVHNMISVLFMLASAAKYIYFGYDVFYAVIYVSEMEKKYWHLIY